MRKLRQPAWFVAIAAAIVLLPTWFYFAFTEFSFFNRSLQPERQAGWTTPYLAKGIAVYVSEREANIATWLFRLDIGLFAVIFLCFAISGGKLGPRPPKRE